MAKFIVIDGLDGSGKATQTAALAKRFKADGKKVVTLSFPHYESDSSAAVRMYLNGELGKNVEDLSPYACSTFYAIDRYISYIKEYKKYFEEDDNTIILADRYLSANIIHQGGKIENEAERQKFIRWCYELECGLYGMPKEDITIVLVLHPEISQALMSSRYNSDEERKDAHESNLEYLMNCYNRVLNTVEFIQNNNIANWEHFNICSEDGKSIENVDIITDKLYNTINRKVGKV